MAEVRIINQTEASSVTGEEFLLIDDSTAGTKKVSINTVLSKLKEEVNNIGVSDDIKQAMLQLASKVAYIDADGQEYYDDLHDALYPPIHATAINLNTDSLTFASLNTTQSLSATVSPSDSTDTVEWYSSDNSVATVSSTGVVTAIGYGSATITASAGSKKATCSVVIAQATLTSIDATYTQSGTVYEGANLDSLKSDLVVTAYWGNSTSNTVESTDYVLSGTLEVGTSTITVTYGGKTDTFVVTVTEYTPQSYSLSSPTATGSFNALDTSYLVNGEIDLTGISAGSNRYYQQKLSPACKVTIETNASGYSLGFIYAVINGNMYSWNGSWHNLSGGASQGGATDVRNKSATTPDVATEIVCLSRSRDLSKCTIVEVTEE